MRLAVTLTLAGEPIPVPEHDFMLRFTICNGRRHYDCTNIGGVLKNCAIDRDNNKVMCFLDNHELGIGELHCEYYDYIPDADFADGNMRKVVPSVLPIELIAGAGDDAEEIAVDVPIDIYGAIADCEAATDAANLAADAANMSTALANAAATEAYAKATEANTAATNANRAASEANAITEQARIAASDAMAAAVEAGDARDLANAAAVGANTAATSANTAAEGATISAARAEQAATTANNAAQRAETAAAEATTLTPRVEGLERAIITDDAEVTLANYATIVFESLGANVDGKGVNIKFTANNQLRYQDAEKTQSLNIPNNTLFTVYQGYGLYYDVTSNRLIVRESPASGEYVTLAIVNRGLITQGKLLEITEHYERLQGGGGDMSNYYTKAETNATFLSKADATSDYYNKTQVDNRLNGYVRNDELGQKIADWTVIAAHFTGGTLDGTWRYYDGAKSIASIIGGTAEESTYAAFVTSLGYKLQGLDAVKPCVMDIVLGENNTVKTVDFLPFVGLYGGGTALFTALGNSADESADATDVVSVHYFLDTERQSWQRAEFDFTNHIYELESSVSGLERMKADKTQLADYLTTSAASTTYLSKSEAQSTYMTEGEVNAKNITAVCVTVQGSTTWKYIEGVFDAADLLSGQTLDNEITLQQFINYCTDYLLGSTELRIVVVEGVVNGTTPEISNVLPLVSYPYPSRTYTAFKFACVGYPVRSNAAPANSCSLISYTLGDDGFGNLEWTRYEYDIDTLLAAKANTADVASTYATIAAMNAGLADKADKVAVTNVVPHGGMLPNVVYNLGTTDTVNITLASPTDNTVANIYCFTFTAQTAACTVTLPNGCRYANETDLQDDIVAGYHYEVTIIKSSDVGAYDVVYSYYKPLN